MDLPTVKVVLKRLTENDLKTAKTNCLKNEPEKKKKVKRKLSTQELISKYRLTTVCFIPPVFESSQTQASESSSSPQPRTTPKEQAVKENTLQPEPINKPLIRVKNSNELGVVEPSHKDNENELVVAKNVRQEIFSSENETVQKRLQAVFDYYFTNQRLSLVGDLINILNLLFINLCEKKKMGVCTSVELDSIDSSELQEFSKRFIIIFSSTMENVDENNIKRFITIVLWFITEYVETHASGVEIIPALIQRLLELENYPDRFILDILGDSNFVTNINTHKSIFEHIIKVPELENLFRLKKEEFFKYEQKEETPQENEQENDDDHSIVCSRTNCENIAQTVCHCFSRSYCSQECQQEDWENDHWENCRGAECQEEYLVQNPS